MNWKLRFKNKATLLPLIGCLIAFVYQICGILGVVAPISEDQATDLVGIFLNLLCGLGILVDPTTQGLGDSEAAMERDEPK